MKLTALVATSKYPCCGGRARITSKVTEGGAGPIYLRRCPRCREPWLVHFSYTLHSDRPHRVELRWVPL